MIKLCEIYMAQNGLLIEMPPKDDGYVESHLYEDDGKDYPLNILWDITELCDIQDRVRIIKVRKVNR